MTLCSKEHFRKAVNLLARLHSILNFWEGSVESKNLHPPYKKTHTPFFCYFLSVRNSFCEVKLKALVIVREKVFFLAQINLRKAKQALSV